MQSPPASNRHLAIFSTIFLVIFLAGLLNSRSAATPTESRIPLYVSAVALQALLVFFIRRGISVRGLSLRDLSGPTPRPLQWLLEVALGVGTAFAIRFALIWVESRIGFVADHTSTLLPHGTLESILWVAVSLTAGVGEELAFRGYLQRQFEVRAGSRAIAMVLQCIFFGMAHGYQGVKPMLITALFGVFVTLLVLWRRNLYAAMVAHAVTDIVGGLWH